MSFAEETILVAAMNGDTEKVKLLLGRLEPTERARFQKALESIGAVIEEMN